jgi:hypothetical protein
MQIARPQCDTPLVNVIVLGLLILHNTEGVEYALCVGVQKKLLWQVKLLDLVV